MAVSFRLEPHFSYDDFVRCSVYLTARLGFTVAVHAAAAVLGVVARDVEGAQRAAVDADPAALQAERGVGADGAGARPVDQRARPHRGAAAHVGEESH